MSDRLVWRVLPDSNRPGWMVRLPSGNDLAAFTLKADALAYARKEARAVWEDHALPTQVVEHNADGKIADESTFGDDPFPPAG